MPRQKIAAVAIAIIAAAVLIYLAVFDPTEAPAPQCLFRRLTGWDCPGCGTQRAVHALMHGHVAEAWRFNAFLFFAVPLIALYALAPKRWSKVIYSPYATLGIACAIVLWWIGRNVFN